MSMSDKSYIFTCKTIMHLIKDVEYQETIKLAYNIANDTLMSQGNCLLLLNTGKIGRSYEKMSPD